MSPAVKIGGERKQGNVSATTNLLLIWVGCRGYTGDTSSKEMKSNCMLRENTSELKRVRDEKRGRMTRR